MDTKCEDSNPAAQLIESGRDGEERTEEKSRESEKFGFRYRVISLAVFFVLISWCVKEIRDLDFSDAFWGYAVK